jgi:hypothetical protein
LKIEYYDASKYGNGARVAEGKVFVTGIKGPLEPNWQREVEAFASRIATSV